MVIWDQKPRASHRLSSGAGHPKAHNLNQTTRHHWSVLHGGHIAIPLGMKEKLWRLADASQSLRNIIFCCLWLMLDDKNVANLLPKTLQPGSRHATAHLGWRSPAENIMERCFALFRYSASIRQQIRKSQNGGKKLPQVHMSQGKHSIFATRVLEAFCTHTVAGWHTCPVEEHKCNLGRASAPGVNMIGRQRNAQALSGFGKENRRPYPSPEGEASPLSSSH